MRSFFFFAVACLTACRADDDGALRPLANAGFDRTARPGETVRLDGSDSDAGVTYAWTLAQQPTGSTATLSDATTATPVLVPDVVGAYMIALTDTREQISSLPDVLNVEADNSSAIAVAECGADSSCLVTHSRTATLDGRGSYDPDGDPLTYNWSQILTAEQCASACPDLADCDPSSAIATIATPTIPLASFTAPAVSDATLVFQLSVNDGTSLGAACLVYTTRNTPPTGVLAPSTGTVNPAAVDEGTAFVLNGAGSGDGDGDALTFAWSQAASSFVASIASPSSQSTSVVAPSIAANPVDLPYVDVLFTLTVDDGLLTDSVEITVRINNGP